MSTKKLAPCGTANARRRHMRNNETCEKCGPLKPRELKPCGTPAAYRRHRTRGETPCDPCKAAHRADDAARHRKNPNPSTSTVLPIEELINEVRFLVNAGEGEARILKALGYQGRANALRQRLANAKQHELNAQIFGWELAA